MEGFLENLGCGWPSSSEQRSSAEKCKTYEEMMATETAPKATRSVGSLAAAALTEEEDGNNEWLTFETESQEGKMVAEALAMSRVEAASPPQSRREAAPAAAASSSEASPSELRVAELAEEMAVLNEDATQLDVELLEVQREMLDTLREQLRVERDRNKALSEELERLSTNETPRLVSDDQTVHDEVYEVETSAKGSEPSAAPRPPPPPAPPPTTTSRESTRHMLRAIFAEYAEEGGLSRRRWAKVCEELGLGRRRDVDLAFYECRQPRFSENRRSHSLNFGQFLDALDALLARADLPSKPGRLGYLEAFLASPVSTSLRARAAVILLDQPKLLAKCGRDMLTAACATVAAAIAAECELLAHPAVIAVVDDNFFALEDLYGRAAESDAAVSLSAVTELLADCWIVPALVSYFYAYRLAAVLVARDGAVDDAHFRHHLLPELLLQKASVAKPSGSTLSFLLFVEFLGHLALRTMAGRTPQARVRALFDWLKKSTPDRPRRRAAEHRSPRH